MHATHDDIIREKMLSVFIVLKAASLMYMLPVRGLGLERGEIQKRNSLGFKNFSDRLNLILEFVPSLRDGCRPQVGGLNRAQPDFD